MDSVAVTTEGVEGDVEGPDEFLRLLRLRLACTPVGLEDWLQPSAGRVPVGAAPADLIDEAIDTALRSIQRLVIDQNAQLDGAALERLAVGLNQVRRAAEAANVAVAERVVATNPFRGDGFLTGKSWLAHRLQLSKREAFHRCQMARQLPRLVLWSEAFVDGMVGVEQTSLMAQVAADPGVRDEALQAAESELLDDAMALPYEEFKRRVLRWQALVDTDGAADQAERVRNQRGATMTEPDSGGWELTARFDDLRGAEYCEAWAHYCQASSKPIGPKPWNASARATSPPPIWPAPTANVEPTPSWPWPCRRRLPTQRDAARAGTEHPHRPSLARRRTPGDEVPPSRFRDVVCRTASGHELDLTETAGMVLWAAVRRVVVDTDKGHVINYGRKRRLFRGASRRRHCCNRCVASGPVATSLSDAARPITPAAGPTTTAAPTRTTPTDSAEATTGSKNTATAVHRDDHGHWHIHHPDGHEIH